MRCCGRIGCYSFGRRRSRERWQRGLTVKQEISAIREALHSDDEEFMTQYGGMQGAVERYKELMTLPEAKLAKGVSIDGYSTFRATRFSEAV